MERIKPKKHLGQHFLMDQNIAKKIVEALKANPNTPVLEIGPGTGMLTKYLLIKYADFTAFDIDQESISYLKKIYPKHTNQFQWMDYIKHRLDVKSVSIIGNFPYSISSQLFFKIWEDRRRVSEVVCMVQKEVADRICATHGNKIYGILSVLLQAFFDVEYLFKVSSGVFNPPPKVQSAVIRLVRNPIDHLPCDEDLFKRLVKAGFGQRRKTLRNALKGLNLFGVESSDEILNKRAEQLSVADFITLTSKITAL
ncbi:MAG: 16S rRNA (adenine(1518)-N(6)/adenine(1519)-N(6))-dimethyltransferase RsmA [Bacteroidota bacterium]